MDSEQVAALRALGVDVDALADQAEGLLRWLEGRGAVGLQVVAVCRLVIQGIIYAEERCDGPEGRARAEEVLRLIAAGHERTARALERGFS